MGQGGVGKTAMVVRYRDDGFVEGYMPTIGDMYTVDEESPYGPRHIEIDDTAGQVRNLKEIRNGALTPPSYLIFNPIENTHPLLE